MNLGRNIPVNTRVTRKKRKLNRSRFLTVLVVLLAITGGGVALALSDFDIQGAVNNVVSLIDIGGDNNPKESTGTNKSQATATDTAKTTDTKQNDNSASGTNTTPGTGEGSGTAGGEKNKVKDYAPLKSDLEAYIKSYKGQYGVYYINLEDNSEFGINDTDEYIAASTTKVPINLYLFNKIKEGTIDPESVMTYTQRDKEGGTGSIQYKSLGSKYKVSKLSELSIEVSDNVAINMLVRLVGKQNYKDFMRQMGGTVVRDDKNVSCPKDMALYMKKIYEFNQKDSVLGGELIGYLKNTIFNDRLPKLLPKEVEVAHKIGNQVGALHDVGIVYAEKPYIIAVMSKNINEAEAYDVIANISKKVYDFSIKE